MYHFLERSDRIATKKCSKNFKFFQESHLERLHIHLTGSRRKVTRGTAPCSYCCGGGGRRLHRSRAPADCDRCGDDSPGRPCRLKNNMNGIVIKFKFSNTLSNIQIRS